MDKMEFKEFCKKEFYKRGFRKIKSSYYLKADNGLLCSIAFHKSNYSEAYYIDIVYKMQEPDDHSIPSYYDMDIHADAISVLSKTQRINGNLIMVGAIEYEEYAEDELRPYFDKAFDEIILPPMKFGKSYFIGKLRTKEHPLNKYDTFPLREDEILKKVYE